jgi:hypothetical protein
VDSLDKQSRIGEIASIRARIKANPALHVELLAAISKTLREHGVQPDKRILSEIALAVPDEITAALGGEVILPGGTNC